MLDKTRGRAPHLVLVGLMGAGKTTVGRVVAERLGRAFVDTDDVAAAQAGATVAELFATEGEAGFRVRERAALADVVASPEPLVVACGGGAMTDAGSRRAVTGECVVWLRAAPATLAARATAEGLGVRPLLTGRDPEAVLRRLAADRAAGYEAVADATVETDGRPVDAVADDVVAAYGVRA
jgi:shikimate kinase